MTEQGQSTRVSRRTIAKGAAWAVPVVPLAVATPAYAQSGCVPTLVLSPDSCKCPGTGQNNWDYFVKVCNTGTTCPDADGKLYVVIRANTGANPIYYPSSGAIEIPVGQCSAAVTFNATNSAGKLRIAYGATAAEARLDTAPYTTVDAPPDCEDGDLGTCTH